MDALRPHRIGLLAAAALLVACAGREAHPQTALLSRAGQMYVLAPADMSAWCHAGPGRVCEQYRVVPPDLVARLDERLTPLLWARKRGFLAPRVQQYVRQYWAVLRRDELYVVGNFACPERVPASSDAARVPLLVDPQGMCRIGALAPVEHPQDVTFSYEW